MRVYLLSTYEEHGADNVMATLDPAELPAMLRRIGNHFAAQVLDGSLGTLTDVLARGELITDGVDLTGGWGGVQLHIVELQGKAP